MANLTKYTEQEVEEALSVLAVVGNDAEASRRTGIPKATLCNWRNNVHATRYDEIRAEVLPKIREALAAQAEQAAQEQGYAAQLLLAKLVEEIPNMKPGEVAGALRNLETSKAINIDKSQLLRGQPTSIIEKRDSQQILDSLAARFSQLVYDDAETIDSTAEEIPLEIEAGSD
jgi:hypothetical protein